MPEFIACTPKSLPAELHAAAAATAVRVNPLNQPNLRQLTGLLPSFTPSPDFIAVVTSKYWHTNGVHLGVGFLDNPPQALRQRILMHMNAWAKTANVHFWESSDSPEVRINRTPGAGHWSYLGTDILQIATGQPTMNLDSFTMETPDSEFYRVVRHETGHTLGCPHEHLRAQLVDLIDPAKAIAFYGATQGWTPQEVQAQVLTPLDQASIMGTPNADQNSIMCYQIPGSITRNGQPIIGGTDIDATDYAFMAQIYPPAVQAPATPPAARAPASTPSTTAASPTATPVPAAPHLSAPCHHGADGATAATIELPGGARLMLNRPLDPADVSALVAALRA